MCHKLSGHEVVYMDTGVNQLAERLKDADAVLLTQQRSNFPRALIEKLPRLRLIGQTGHRPSHIDIEPCTQRGIVVSTRGVSNPEPAMENVTCTPISAMLRGKHTRSITTRSSTTWWRLPRENRET